MNKFEVAELLAELATIDPTLKVIEEDIDSAEFTVELDKKKFTISVREI